MIIDKKLQTKEIYKKNTGSLFNNKNYQSYGGIH